MDYLEVYDAIVARARTRSDVGQYVERHHVAPRSLRGTDDPSNIVALTYREHFLAHWLLTKLTTGTNRRKMLFALKRMTSSFSDRVVSGWQYEIGRRAQREAKAGEKQSEATRQKRAASMLGNKNSLGYSHTVATRQRQRDRMMGNTIARGFRHSDATRDKRSLASAIVWHGYTEEQRSARAAKVSAGFARRRASKGPQPWVVLGMSRRTWYRRGKPLQTATGG